MRSHYFILYVLVLLFADQSSAAAENMQPLESFKDCPDCPELVVIPSGSFEMGKAGSSHRVTLQRFAIGKTEVTQRQWKAVMGNNPGAFRFCGGDCPVELVSWINAQSYIRKLSEQTGKQYRLPSESEWEYACRAGQQQEYCGGDTADSVAWIGVFSLSKTHRAGGKQANAFGLYDMSGNVWEWVTDNYHANLSEGPTDGSAWLGGSTERVLRGGSWNEDPLDAGAASRSWFNPLKRYNNLGFRVARTLP